MQRLGHLVAASLLLLLLLVSSIPQSEAKKASKKESTTGNSTDATMSGKKARAFPAAAGEQPACCAQLLTPMLPFLGAPSLDALKLPVLILSTNGGTLRSDKNRVKGAVCVCGSPNGTTNYDFLPTKFGVRGSTSVKDFTRKSFALTIKSQPRLLGMPKHKEWGLYAPEGDVALLRNSLAFNLWQRTGRWGPRNAWAEVFVTTDMTTPLTKDSYYGLYLAMEKIWHGKHRINVEKYDPVNNPTGGFIFRIEHGKPKNVPEVDTRLTGQIILIDDPRTNVSDASLQYLTKHFNDFERQLLAPGLGNFSNYVSPEGLVDWFLANELIKSANDGYRGSVYFWKDSDTAGVDALGQPAADVVDSDGLKTSQIDGRVVMGPVWDAAKAMGLCCGFPVEGYQAGGVSSGSSGGSAISPEGWLFNICLDKRRCRIDPTMGLSQWYIALWGNEGFRANVSARYSELRASAWSDAWFSGQVRNQSTQVHDAALRTYIRWAAAFASDKVQLSPPGAADYPASLNASISYLHDWLLGRLKWMDSQLLSKGAGAGAGAAGQPNGVAAAGNAAQPGATTSGNQPVASG